MLVELWLTAAGKAGQPDGKVIAGGVPAQVWDETPCSKFLRLGTLLT